MTCTGIRTATRSDIDTMLDWAASEGWNPGLDDAAAFLAADPEGFFVAEADGAPVACISVVNHSADFAFLGFYICHPAHRGRGIGLRLWQHALKHAGDRTVGLDGVAAQEANYARSGFLRYGATHRMEGVLTPCEDNRITAADPSDLSALLALDQAANGYARPGFLATWISPSEHRRSLVLRDGQHPSGFATARRCRSGIKIGPIVAKDAEDALALARASVAIGPSSRVIIDVPSGNAPLLSALERMGFAETFATARMYRGPAPAPSGNLQAIGTMELG